jgi:hypothetical protein
MVGIFIKIMTKIEPFDRGVKVAQGNKTSLL